MEPGRWSLSSPRGLVPVLRNMSELRSVSIVNHKVILNPEVGTSVSPILYPRTIAGDGRVDPSLLDFAGWGW